MTRPAAHRLATLLLALAAALPAAAAGARPASPDAARLHRVADVLFPSTKGWRRLDAVPEAPRAAIDSVAAAEHEARALARRKPDCLDAVKLTSVGGGKGFRILPLMGPGTRSLIYSGPSGCVVDWVTVVWRDMGRPDIGRFEANGETLRLKVPVASGEPFPLLRIERNPGETDVETYSLVPRPGETESIVVAHAGLAVPPAATPSTATFTVPENTALRADPEGPPPYDPEDGRGSRERPTPDEVAAGSAAREHLRHRDAAGREWSLVTAPTAAGGAARVAGWMPTPAHSPSPRTGRDAARRGR